MRRQSATFPGMNEPALARRSKTASDGGSWCVASHPAIDRRVGVLLQAMTVGPLGVRQIQQAVLKEIVDSATILVRVASG